MATLSNNTPSGVTATGLPAAIRSSRKVCDLPAAPGSRQLGDRHNSTAAFIAGRSGIAPQSRPLAHPFALDVSICQPITLPLSGLRLVTSVPGAYLFKGGLDAAR